MKRKSNPLRINKNINKSILIFVMLIFFISILLFVSSLSSKKKNSVSYKNFGQRVLPSSVTRRSSVESAQENTYNIGDYEVNLTPYRRLKLNISVQSNDESFQTLTDNNILVQNAVLEAFGNYSSIHKAGSVKGKEKIKKHIKDNINNSLPQAPIIEKVYFNKFLIR